MVELTYGGAWFKWSSLEPCDRNWALLSFATSFLAVIPIGIPVYDQAYRLGFRVGSGGKEAAVSRVTSMLESGWYSYAMLASTLFAIVSAFAWWRLSRNQDEMFNRIQNYALAQAGGWTFATLFIWWLLWLGGWVSTVSATAIVALGFILLTAFWFRAVAKWL